MSDGKTMKNYWAFGTKGWGVALAGLMFYYFWQGPLYGGSNYWFTAFNEKFGWSVPSMALPITLAGILSVFGVMLFGALAKKIGAKRVIVMCLVLAAACNMLFAVFQTLWSFQVAIILFFFFSMGYSVIGVGQLGADWFPRTKGVYMGIVTVGGLLNTATIALLLVFIIPRFGIFYTMVAFAALQLIFAVLVGAFIKNTPEEAGAYPDNDKSVSREELMKEFKAMEEYKKISPWTVKALLACPTTWKIAISLGLCAMCGVGIVQQLAQALHGFGHSTMLGITILTVSWPIGFLAHVLVGVIDLRFGTKNTCILMAFIMAVCPIILLLFGSNVVWAVIGTGFLLFGISGIQNVIMSMTTTSFGRKDFENAWPVVSCIFQLISNAGVLIIAELGATNSYRMAFTVVLAVLLIAAIIMFTMPKTQIAAPR